MRVAILPTGAMEWKGLPGALNALFPGHDFYPLPSEAEKQSHPNEFPAFSFTSVDVTKLPPDRANLADKLVLRALREVLPDSQADALNPDKRRSRPRADLVIIVDDLELVNADQPDAVVSTVKAAVGRVVKTAPQAASVLREKVSFHLAVPMIESWLFADPTGPSLAGVPLGRQPLLSVGADFESFVAIDTDYDADNGDACTAWGQLAGQKAKNCKPLWVKISDAKQRAQHPKAYLAWLCRAPDRDNCSTYQETKGGAEALMALDWKTVLANQAHGRFLRSLVCDLADRLNEPLPPGETSPETWLTKESRNLVLRNL